LTSIKAAGGGAMFNAPIVTTHRLRTAQVRAVDGH
jgi:hypothetical protein